MFDAPLLIIQDVERTKPGTRQRVFRKIASGQISEPFSDALLRLVNRLELPQIRQIPSFNDYKRKVHIDAAETASIRIKPRLSPSGFVFRFADDDLPRIEDLNIDVLLRCGSGILKGKILDIAPFGVLSLHHDDNRAIRGGPSGFWGVYLDTPSSGFIIQKLTEELDGGEVLRRGNLMTATPWYVNNAQLLRKGKAFLIKMLEGLALTRTLPPKEPPVLYGGQLYRSPSATELARYCWATHAKPALAKTGLRLLGRRRRGHWAVSYLRGNGFDSALYRGTQIENPQDRYLAAPFVIGHDGRTCFVENYFCNERKGNIWAVE